MKETRLRPNIFRRLSKLRMLANLFRNPQVVQQERDAALRRLIYHAHHNVLFYKELFKKTGLTPGSIRSVQDLQHLPVVDKNLLVEAETTAWDPRVPCDEMQTMTTSGTSGQTITVPRTLAEMIVLRMSFARPLLLNNARPGQRFITFASPWLEARKGQIFSKVAATRFIDPLSNLEDQIKTFQDFRPHGVIGQAGGIYLLAREMLRRKQFLPIKHVFVYGTTLMPEMRAVMQQAFGSRPVDFYGAVEFGWIAWECSRGNLHLDADRLIVEILDDHNRPLPPGQPGHVVVTSLYGYTMPFIRYRLADIAALSTRTCSCRCRFPLLEPVQGRVNDFLPTPAGDRVSPHFFFHLFDNYANPVKEWRLTQNTLHELVYEYIPDPHFNAQVFENGMNLIRQRFGPQVCLRTECVADIPLTSAGKRMCIVSKLRPSTLAGVVPWTDPIEMNGRITLPPPPDG